MVNGGIPVSKIGGNGGIFLQIFPSIIELDDGTNFRRTPTYFMVKNPWGFCGEDSPVILNQSIEIVHSPTMAGHRASARNSHGCFPDDFRRKGAYESTFKPRFREPGKTVIPEFFLVTRNICKSLPLTLRWRRAFHKAELVPIWKQINPWPGGTGSETGHLPSAAAVGSLGRRASRFVI